MIRRRRPAPAADPSASAAPLSRAQLVRDEASEAIKESASGVGPREAESRSKFGALTPITSATSIPGIPGQQRTTGPRAPGRARRASTARELYDRWTFVLVPPGAGARPRTLSISVRRLRFVVASFLVLFSSTLATGGVLVFALSFLPPAQDEVRGVELGVFASVGTTDPVFDAARAESLNGTAGIAAASAGAAAPRDTRGRPGDRLGAGAGDPLLAPSIMESLPVVGEITSRFARARRHPLLGVVRKHAGIDIAASAGTPITAPAPGRVSYSGRKFGYGNVVDIDHGNGVITRYAHCRALMVRVGDEVAAGAVIATVGRTGLATAPHLHYEVLVRGRNVNPLKTSLPALIAGKPVPPAAISPAPAPAPVPDPASKPARPAPVAPLPDDVPLSDTTDIPSPTPSPDTIVTVSAPPVPRTAAMIDLPAGLFAMPGVPAPARDTAKKS
jgi:murein DD-endopeptidase MepM/ murein hydrolase activator NlpD